MKTITRFWSYLAQFFLEREMFQIRAVEKIKMFQVKVLEKIKTYILCLIRFFFLIVSYVRYCEKRLAIYSHWGASVQYFFSGKAISITYRELVCSLRYPASSAHAPCFCLWHARFYNIFTNYLLISGTILGGGGGYWTWNVFWFSQQLFSETFFIPRIIDRGMIENTLAFI
jgi:hypothetical protein